MLRCRKLQLNFLVSEMTFLKYFIPIIVEGNKRGISSKVFIRSNNKYTDPYNELNFPILKKHSEDFNFEILDLEDIKNYSGVTFTVEGVDIHMLGKNHKKIVLTYQTDFVVLFDRYKNEADHIIFPSEKFATYYEKQSDKNLYLGSPKYDNLLEREDILKRYGLSEKEKYVLLPWPRVRDESKVDLNMIVQALSKMGFFLLIKCRGKEPHLQLKKAKMSGQLSKTRAGYWEDEMWNPHPSLDLVKVADFVLNFDSTIIKETALLRKNVINFHIKPFDPMLSFLYEYDYCLNLDPKILFDNFSEKVLSFYDKKHDEAFDRSIKDNLFETGNSSKKILDYFSS